MEIYMVKSKYCLNGNVTESEGLFVDERDARKFYESEKGIAEEHFKNLFKDVRTIDNGSTFTIYRDNLAVGWYSEINLRKVYVYDKEKHLKKYVAKVRNVWNNNQFKLPFVADEDDDLEALANETLDIYLNESGSTFNWLDFEIEVEEVE